MFNLENISKYRSAWEEVNNLPVGPPLRKRHALPDFLSTGEIASLLSEFEDEQRDIELLLERAIHNGEFASVHQAVLPEDVDPLMVIQNLHSHIHLLEKKLYEFKSDICATLERNVAELEDDIRHTQKSAASALQEYARNPHEMGALKKRRSAAGTLFGGLLKSKTRMPLRAERAIAYPTRTQGKTVYLLQAKAFKLWLRSKNEWPISDHLPLSRWYAKTTKIGERPLVNPLREEILRSVANDLASEGINPLSYPGRVSELFELCRKKAISVHGNARGFTDEETWKKHFWNKGKFKHIKTIIRLKDARSRRE